MTATVEPTATAVKVRWYRRRPPVTFDRFQRGVWWTGHAQLYIAIAFAILGPAMLIGYDLMAEFIHFYDWPYQWSLLLMGTAAPFWFSARLLRGYAQVAEGRHRALRLAGTILGIAALCIVATFLCILILIPAVGMLSIIVFSLSSSL